MALTVANLADLAEHIAARRRLYALALAADIELLSRAYGENVVEEALRLADEAAQPKQAPQTPSAKPAAEIADALGRVMAGSGAEPAKPPAVRPPTMKHAELEILDRPGGGKSPFKAGAVLVLAK